MSSQYASQAGAFAMLLMQRYLDDVHAASYPHTPTETGGTTYTFFNERYGNLAEDLKKGSVSKAEIGEKAIVAIRDYLNDESLSGEAARSFSLSMNTAYEHFSSRMVIIDRLEAGEKAQDILSELREGEMDQDHGFPQIQTRKRKNLKRPRALWANIVLVIGIIIALLGFLLSFIICVDRIAEFLYNGGHQNNWKPLKGNLPEVIKDIPVLLYVCFMKFMEASFATLLFFPLVILIVPFIDIFFYWNFTLLLYGFYPIIYRYRCSAVRHSCW